MSAIPCGIVPRFRRKTRSVVAVRLLASLAATAVTTALLTSSAPARDDELLESLLGDIGSPRVLLHIPMDGHTDGLAPAYRLRNLGKDKAVFEKGIVGQAARCETTSFIYPTLDILDETTGSLVFWFKRDKSSPPPRDAFVANKWIAGKKNMLDRGDDDWHFWAISWRNEGRDYDVYLDCEFLSKGTVPQDGFGVTFSLIKGHAGLMDEVYFLDKPLNAEDMRRGFERGRGGKPTFEEAAELKPSEYRYEPDISSTIEQRPPLPKGLDWRQEPDRGKATRVRYALDGFWRLQPFGAPQPVQVGETSPRREQFKKLEPKPEPWAFVKVPGSWKPFGDDSFSHSSAYEAPDASNPLARWQDISLTLYPSAWLERDFHLQNLEEENGVYLILQGCRPTCSIFLNGKFALHHESSSRREYDITKHVAVGRNRITVLAGRSYDPLFEMREGKRCWLPSGLTGSAAVEVRKCGYLAVQPPIPVPSVRNRSLGVELTAANSSEKKLDLTVNYRVRDPAASSVRDLGSRALSLAEGESRVFRESFPFPDPPLWSPDDPRLLFLECEVLRDGKPADEPDPVRFGFREVWTDGGNLVMNGAPFRLRGQCHSFGSESRSEAELQVSRLRELGFNSSIGLFLGPYAPRNTRKAEQVTLDVSDEQGFMLNYKIYVYGKGMEERLESARRNIAKYRSHPSVVLITRAEYGYLPGGHGSPISMGMPVTDEIRAAPGFISDLTMANIVHEAAPGLPFAHYQAGLAGDYRSLMQYIGPGTPFQTREEWPRYWAEQRPAPFVGNELDVILANYLWNWQAGRGLDSKSPEPLITEHAARYFGEAAYERETKENVEAFKPRREEDESADIFDPNANLLNAECIKRTMRSWRTCGISYFILGISPSLLESDMTNPVKQAYNKNNNAFLAYIGGEAGDFARKDHAYFTGEQIAKQVILINDHFRDIKANAEWRLVACETDKPVAGGSGAFTLKPGEILKHPFAFSAPEAGRKTRFKIELRVEAEGEASDDSFPVEVFPPALKPDIGKARVLLADPEGRTSAMLARAGIEFRAVKLSASASRSGDLADADLLIIGRRGLPADPAVQDAIFRAAREGLNVLCFEQVERSVFGLRNDDPNTRNAFVSDRLHPVMDGLDDEDFRNWRGASDILDPYPDYRSGVEYGYLNHKHARGYFGQSEFAHWSANGTVASFHYEKPQTGRFRILLSSGFDLLYSPLLELVAGRGRITLCQLDVSNRYGVDPVATLVVNRLLSRALQREPGAETPLVFAGAASWKSVLNEIHAETEDMAEAKAPDEKAVLFVGLSSATSKRDTGDLEAPAPTLALDKQEKEGSAIAEFLDEMDDKAAAERPESPPPELARIAAPLVKMQSRIRDFVQSGGTLVVAGLSSPGAGAWLPVRIGVKEAEVFRGDPSGISILAGLTDSDFFLREVVTLPVISDAPAGSTVEPNGIFADVPCGKGRVVFCQLAPDDFPKAWQRTKILRIYSVLLANLGVPAAALETGAGTDSLSTLFYSTNALSFNPDQHTSW